MGDGARKRRGIDAIGLHAARALKATFEERGFNVADVLNQWPAIVGTDFAAFTAPERINWPKRQPEEQQAAMRLRRKPEGATLLLRVHGPRAIEVQHRADVIRDRINTYFGWQAIGSLRFLQAPVERNASRRNVRPGPTEALVGAHASRLGGVEDEGLKRALARLGAEVEVRHTE